MPRLQGHSQQDEALQARYRRQRRRRRGLYLVVALLIIGSLVWALRPVGKDTRDLSLFNGRLVNAKLLALPANRWVRIAPRLPAIARKLPFASLRNLFMPAQGWTRQSHAGLAFDSKRDALIVFGSDSHGENWDNSVHEFSPLTLTWTTDYPPSPKETYHADSSDAAVAGRGGRYPWAMHTYDNIVYAPVIDALVVTSQTDHTPPPTSAARKARRNPTWIYHLGSHEWEHLQPAGVPSFFGAGSTYDPATKSVWAYHYRQLWRLALPQLIWQKVPSLNAPHLGLHFVMTTDVLRHQLVFFGSYWNSNTIWVYTPAPDPNQPGIWTKRQPSGDDCPKDQHFPVAFDRGQGVFLLVPHERPGHSVTFVYSPDDNRYIRVPGSAMPSSRMNYMMVYDPYHRVFLWVRGDHHSPVTVWAFRLDMKALRAAG